MLVTSKEMLERAKVGGYALVAPDYYDNNSCRAFVQVAEELNKPLILSFAAEVHDSMLSLEEAALIGRYYAETAKVDIALHLDHGTKFDTIKKAIAYGFTSVMIDASSCDFEENVRRTKEVVEYAHARGVVVEAEIGHVGSGETYATDQDDLIYTEVEAAKKFVELTGVDSLAISIGTAHGHYKGIPVINFERLHEIREALDIPLVLHGGSSSGDENLRRCATEGISKINVFTDFVVAAYEAAKNGNPKDWFELLHMSDEGIKNVLRHYYRVFNCVE
ncbi:MAG TPA: class II fructose-bisphosphate aldolase [Erysipelotrichaceae bacterium]|nr:class II fructose-bisphosphate aldolase [Erysipelotrichaceae bacterium]HQA85008.1 class II fructose-bisphosphate aldolase [Erysipelotrichaceae bacterium]